MAEVGIHTRDKEALLNFKTWRDIPESERQVCYDHFKEIFAVDAHASEIDFKRVTGGVSESLRKYRHRLKNHFDKHLPFENARLHPYVGIHIDLWKNLCDWWMSPEFQVKESEERQSEEDGEVESHQEGPAIRLYKETHCREETGWVHEKAKRNYDEMMDKPSQICQNSDSTSPVRNDVEIVQN
ncbi:uncharacterized protein LOC132300297 [Cornus florida]|uniref:uncharacterized protein LOC132300297 n=1 Tax=Cornus florida TaxID=4283 RepID=UPI00289C4950|nr:uncharacterized protein LOC132300297 [Cornus florida]XP_059653302.1 uncharacterized protein LOC132300297 [Cornus florida]XP_059653303.1 uncharacterized protein LOC132300297 [Cornus florida]